MNEFIEWNTLELKKTSGSEKIRCPKCDNIRSDKRDKSLVIYHNNGIGRCFYCNALTFRDSKKQERETKVNYTLPSQEWRNYTKLSDKLVKWFENRGIKQYVLNDFCISEEVMYQPQLNKAVNNVVFNYFEGELLVNKKYRSANKKFTQSKNGKPILYNINSVIGCEEVYVTEGECFKGSTEVLTNKGWVSFDNYKGEDICQVDEFKKYSFVKPLNIIKKKYNDDLVKLSNSRNFEITTTKNHNIIVEDSKGVLSKVKAIDIFLGKSNHKKIPRVCNGTDKEDYNISDNDLRLQVMFSADFTFRKEGDLYAGFKKERKIERVKMLLDKSEFEYSCNKVKNGYTSVFISRKFNTKRFSKLFNNEWLSLLSERQLKIILDEIVHWDGNSVPNRNQIEYSSKEYHNITFIQTIAHLLGYMSTVIPRSNKFGSWYKASILFNKKHTSLQLSTKKELEKHNDFVYCVSVPTGMILVRQNNQISICGNCDVLSLAQIGIKNAVSLPTGANDNDAFWINSEKYLKDVKKFYIAVDNDEKGNEVAEKIAQRLGRYRCERVIFEGKDANEDLVNGCLEESILNTEKYPVSGTYSVDDVWSDVLDLLKNGIPETIKPKGEWCKGLNDIFSVMRGHLIVSTGIPSHGKALDINTLIPTPSGFKKMIDLKVGDEVFDENGKECFVKWKSEVWKNRPTYKITFSDNSTMIADENHEWITDDVQSRKYKRGVATVKTTKEIANTLKVGSDSRNNHSIKLTKPIICEEKDLPIDPYVLGCWLGDGTSSGSGLTNSDDEVIENIKKRGYILREQKRKHAYSIAGIHEHLKALNLLNNKHIPIDYLFASENQRWDLLRGLMDTDGHSSIVEARNEYCGIHYEFVRGVYQLICSLGMKATFVEDDAKIYGRVVSKRYRVFFKTNSKIYNLPRKQKTIDDYFKTRKTRGNDIRYITNCELVTGYKTQCIEVSSKSHLFLAGEQFIPTHNSNFTDWYVLNLIQDYGMKASWFSPEHNPMSLYVTNLGTKALGTNLFKATEQQRNDFKEWATEKIYLTNADSGQEPNWEWLLDTFQNQMMRYGIDIFVIDAWNKVILNDKNELQGIRRVLTKLTAFAQQNNVMIFLVAHPTKMKKNEKTQEYEQPTLYDVAGSADFRNQTHDGFCVYRYFNEGKTTITNLKTKMSFQGDIGKSADFYYNIENGRYYDCATQKNNLPLWHDNKPSENKYYKSNVLPTPSYQEAFNLNTNDDDYCPF